MKSKYLLVVLFLILIIIFNLILFAEESKYDFRKTNWGMSQEQVKAIENKEPSLEVNSLALVYKYIKINTKDFTCIYQFLEDKLYNGGYIFTGEHTNKNFYIDNYKELRGILISKYGKPIRDKIEWKNDLYRDDKSRWGMAISIGHLEYWAWWETLTTKITLMLNGDNHKIGISLHYDSKELEEWVKQIKEEKTKKDF